MTDLNDRPPTLLVSYRELKSLGIPYSRKWIAELVRHNAFPQPIRLTPRRVVWKRSSIEEFIEQAAAPTKPALRIVK